MVVLAMAMAVALLALVLVAVDVWALILLLLVMVTPGDGVGAGLVDCGRSGGDGVGPVVGSWGYVAHSDDFGQAIRNYRTAIR
jgi:hypothetical protein